jgi:predicted DNA-binding transcriptional regulator AlpA
MVAGPRNPHPAPAVPAPAPRLQPAAAAGPSQPGALRREEAAAYCGVSASTWDEWRRRGLAPDPLPVQRDSTGRPRVVRWATSHLDIWLMHGQPDRAKFRAMLDVERRVRR